MKIYEKCVLKMCREAYEKCWVIINVYFWKKKK